MGKTSSCVYLVISSVGPEKLVPGRKMPAATSLVVSVPNFSAKMVTFALGNCFCSSSAVDKPITPDPTTKKCIFVVLMLRTVFICDAVSESTYFARVFDFALSSLF